MFAFKVCLVPRTALRFMRGRLVSTYPVNIPNPLPATFLRGGTSKGIYLNRSDLPEDPAHWTPIFLGIMGSPDPEHGRQLNGMGGGVSSLSKICVVGPPVASRRNMGIDAEYTFCQIGIRDASVDYSGNCGNLSSMIGVFAVDEGICRPRLVSNDVDHPTATVRAFNTNTNKLIDTTFPVTTINNRATAVLDLKQSSVAGVPGRASQITLDFVSPGGARTGKLLPSGNPVDVIDTSTFTKSPSHVRVSLVDATNPSVFVGSDDLRKALGMAEDVSINYTSATLTDFLEFIRQKGAERMGLDPSAQAQPKIAVLSSPTSTDSGVDIVVHALSMGVLHKAVPMTVGLCLGVSARIRGTLAWETVNSSNRESSELLTIRHSGGTVDVGADFSDEGEVRSAKVVRTGRRLMKGVVWW